MFKENILKELPVIFSAKELSSFIGGGKDGRAANGAASSGWALSFNTFIEDDHFPSEATPGEVAGKVLAAALSDLAGSACRPRWAMASLCLHKGLMSEWARSFAKELEKRAVEFGVGISVNDMVALKNCTTVMVAMAGEPLAGGPILRGGGNYDDVLVVTGELGGSRSGRHLAPVPRLREIALLMDFCANNPEAAHAFPTALMDTSDGIAMSLFIMCHESKTGAVLYADRIPVSAAAVEMAQKSGQSALEHALNDGEDYELLIALPPRVWNAFKSYLASPEGVAAARGLAPFTEVGNLSSVLNLRLQLGNGTLTRLEPVGRVASAAKNGDIENDAAENEAASAPDTASAAPPRTRHKDVGMELRIIAMRMIASGRTVTETAEFFNVEGETVRRWIAEFSAGSA